MFRLSFYPIFDSYLLVAAVALLLAGLLAFGPSRRRARRGQRAILVLLRAGVILLVLLAMLRPTLVYTQTRKQAATLAVLVDRSRSMTAPDAVGDRTRWEAMRRALDSAAPALGRLAKEFELKAYSFDADVQALNVEDGKIRLPDAPTGDQTAIGAAIEDVVRREAGKRLLGVVLLSDGAQRAYAPRDLPPQVAAARLKRLGCPLFTVPFGRPLGPRQTRDVAVEDLVVPARVFVKNELTIGGQIRIDGYVDLDIPVRVLFETSPGKMEVIAQQSVRATADGLLLPVRFRYVPRTPGERKITLEAVPQMGELVTINNELSTFVNVLAGGLNVLYIEGALRVETKFLRRSLDSSPDIKVDYVRLDARDARSRPPDFAERFKPGKYDVYILGDVDATAFRGDELARLAETVHRGAGLIMLGGFQTFGPGGYASTPLAQVLPIGMDRLERQRREDPIRNDLHWPGPLQMLPTWQGLSDLRLADQRRESTALWSKLPPLEGANKFHDLAPGATVLAEAGPDRPLLVAHPFGDGRAMAFAGDSTWRWWMRGYESAHKRFWRQIVLWLARKDQTGDGNVWIQLAERRFTPSARVEFFAGARSPTGEPIPDAEIKAEVVLPNGVRRPATLARQNEQMAGVFRETQSAGDYAIEVVASQNGKTLGTAKARFLVTRQDLELGVDNASANIKTLETLAAMADGKSLPPEELPEQIQRLAEGTQHLEVQQQMKKTFWDTWALFLTLVVLLGVEWYLRKRWGMV